MTPERFQKVREVFAAARGMAAPAREAYLALACESDVGLRAEVSSLLAGATSETGFLDTPLLGPGLGAADADASTHVHDGSPAGGGGGPSAAAAATAREEGPAGPRHVGPYRVLERLGEGGMGTVYKAEQRGPVRRVVAVKRIKPGVDSAEVVARFESERQALARMDHPNVAKVLDAGADDLGRPYFVMEYVPGLPITDFADAHRLTVRQRLELFTQVCGAVAHAHTKAIIHRDIKPGNVLAYLADGRPAAKVIDFGIAKALTADRLTDLTFNTGVGRAIGTFASMSPEQADGSPDIDTRADVYSLGVLLYELLAGAKPFDKATLARAAENEVCRIIREVEPDRPSTRLSGLPGDTANRVAAARRAQPDGLARELRSELEWIPLKAMRKERDRRYASPAQLAEDIARYLAGEPLLAGPETRAYRGRKFIARHRSGLAVATAFALLAGAAAAAYVHGIRAEQQRTALALQDAQDQRAEADRQRTAAQDKAAEAKKQAAEADRQRDEARASKGEAERQRGEAQARKADAEKQAAEAERQRGEAQASRADAERSAAVADDQRKLALDTLLALIADVQAKLDRPGMLDARKSILGVAVQGLGKIDRGSGDAAARADRYAARADDQIGNIFMLLGKTPEAHAAYAKAFEVRRALATSNPDGGQAKRELAVSHDHLGDVRLRAGDTAGAREDYERSLGIRRQLAAADPDAAAARRDLSASYHKLGDVCAGTRDIAGAKGWYENALAVDEALAAADPASLVAKRDLSLSLNKLGDMFIEADDFEAAERPAERSLAIGKELAAAKPDDAEARRDLSICYEKVGNVVLRLGRPAAAKQSYQQALDIRQAMAAADPANAEAQRDLTVSLVKLGEACTALDDPAGAAALYGKALSVREWLAAEDPESFDAKIDLVVNLLRLGDAADAAGNRKEAASARLRALGMLRQLDKEGKLKDRPRYRGWIWNLSLQLSEVPDEAPAAATKPTPPAGGSDK